MESRETKLFERFDNRTSRKEQHQHVREHRNVQYVGQISSSAFYVRGGLPLLRTFLSHICCTVSSQTTSVVTHSVVKNGLTLSTLTLPTTCNLQCRHWWLLHCIQLYFLLHTILCKKSVQDSAMLPCTARKTAQRYKWNSAQI